jgi:hypothetical protein
MIVSFSFVNIELGMFSLQEQRETRTTKNIGLVDLIFFSFWSVQTVDSDLIGGVPLSFLRVQLWQMKLFKPRFLAPPRCPRC